MKAADLVAVPPGLVTATSLVPAEPDGVVAVMVVALVMTTFVAATPPTVTVVAPVRLVPVMVMAVPPLADPLVGETDVMVGAAR